MHSNFFKALLFKQEARCIDLHHEQSYSPFCRTQNKLEAMVYPSLYQGFLTRCSKLFVEIAALGRRLTKPRVTGRMAHRREVTHQQLM